MVAFQGPSPKQKNGIRKLLERVRMAWAEKPPPAPEDLLALDDPETMEIGAMFAGKKIDDICFEDSYFCEQYPFAFLPEHGTAYYMGAYVQYALECLLNHEDFPLGCIDTPVSVLLGTLCAKDNAHKKKIRESLDREQRSCIVALLSIVRDNLGFFHEMVSKQYIEKAMAFWENN